MTTLCLKYIDFPKIPLSKDITVSLSLSPSSLPTRAAMPFPNPNSVGKVARCMAHARGGTAEDEDRAVHSAAVQWQRGGESRGGAGVVSDDGSRRER